MRRSGVGIDNGECDLLLILRGERYSHNFPMQVYVFGVAYIPGLYHFLSDRFNPFAVPFTCQPPCGVTFPDVGIYTGDKKVPFISVFFMCDDVDGSIGERDLFFPVESLSISLYKVESFLPGVSRNTCHAGVFEMPE